MSGLEDLVQAAMAAPPERREAALRLLQGNLPKPEPFLTLAGLGRRLGFSARTLSRWQIPGHDLGTCKRYRLTEVEAYLRSESFERRQAALRAERRIEQAEARFRFDAPGIEYGAQKTTITRERNNQYGSTPTTHK